MPTIRISKRSVDSLQPAAARYVAWDDQISGFGVRVGVNGVRTYVFRYRLDGGRGGRLRWATIGRHGTLTPDQARAIASQWAAEVRLGADPHGTKMTRRSAPTVADLLQRYATEHVALANKPRTQENVRYLIDRVLLPDPISRRRTVEVSGGDISQFMRRMSSAPVLANRAFAALSKSFALAEVWGLRPTGSNPCRGITRYREQPKERFLSHLEFERLGTALALAEQGSLTLPDEAGSQRRVHVSRWAIGAIKLLLMTGARRGEVLSLRWEWVDWQNGRANLPDSKTGRKPLMLPPAALQVLQSLGPPSDCRGFVIRGGHGSDPERPLTNIKDPWGMIREAAGLSDVRLHDLRHSFASVMAAGGASLPMIGALLGHRSTATTARYSHLSTDPLRIAADHVGGLIATMTGQTGPADSAAIVAFAAARPNK